MEWKQEDILELLDLYKEQDNLWNPRHPDHMNSIRIINSWIAISDKFIRNYTICDLSNKIISLMDKFHKVSQKVEEIKKTDKVDEVVVTWFAYDKMASFLLDVNKPCTNLNSVEIPKTSSVTDVKEEDTPDKAETAEIFQISTTPKSFNKKGKRIESLNEISKEGACDEDRKEFSEKPEKKDSIYYFCQFIEAELRSLDCSLRRDAISELTQKICEFKNLDYKMFGK